MRRPATHYRRCALMLVAVATQHYLHLPALMQIRAQTGKTCRARTFTSSAGASAFTSAAIGASAGNSVSGSAMVEANSDLSEISENLQRDGRESGLLNDSILGIQIY